MFHRRYRRRPSSIAAATALALALACAKDDASKPTAASAGAAAPSPAASLAQPLADLPPLPEPPTLLGPPRKATNNPTTPAKVRLGQQLFFDPALSVDGTRSC